ncbi:MAG: wax ester/triacylglycerol synthase family O-acyltransferase [Candidatus Binatia bacterium]
MKRMAGADAQHLYRETRVQHDHTIKIAILDPSTSHVDLSFAATRERVGEILPRIPPFRWRLVKVPFGLCHPLWADDPKLDLNYHVRRAAVPSPGGVQEFCEVVSTVASVPLERDRPLWQLWVVEGLEQGHFAYVIKMHHALADGTSSAQILVDLLSQSPEPTDLASKIGPLVADVIPPSTHLIVDGIGDVVRMTMRFPALVRRSMAVLKIGAARKKAGAPQPTPLFSGPPTRYNNKFTPHRTYANVTVALDDMRLVKEAFGVSLNDVLLAMTGGAVRGYLEGHRELPPASLTASVPVSIRKPEELRTYGNRLAMWYVSLATDYADPVERLRAVARSTRAAREDLDSKDRELLHDWMEYWWLFKLFYGLQALAILLLRRPSLNVIVSNVRGPSVPLYSGGARVLGIMSMGPLFNDVGLNVTAWSYLDQMSIGIVACHEHVPDIWDLADRFPTELQRLVAAAANHRPAPERTLAAAS